MNRESPSAFGGHESVPRNSRTGSGGRAQLGALEQRWIRDVGEQGDLGSGRSERGQRLPFALGYREHHVEPRQQTGLVPAHAAGLHADEGRRSTVGLELGVAAPHHVLRVVLVEQPDARERIRDVLGHQPAVDEDRVVAARGDELGNAIGHLRAPVPLDAERHAFRVARNEAADRTAALQRHRDQAPGVSFPGAFVVTAETRDLDVVLRLQVREERCRFDRSAAARLVQPAGREEEDLHAAGPIEHREDGEDDGRTDDPGQPSRFERKPPQPLEPERSERARCSALRARPHVERSAHADHDPDRRERIRMARDPPLLFRSAEPDEHDRRRGRADRVDHLVVSLRGSPEPSSSTSTPAPATTTFDPGSVRHRAAARSATSGAPPTNATVSPRSAASREQRRDLDARPPPKRTPVSAASARA